MRRFWTRLLFSGLMACCMAFSQQAAGQGSFIVHTKLTNPNPDGFFGPDGIPVYTGHIPGPNSVLSIDLNHDGIEDYRVVATGTVSLGFQMEGTTSNLVWSRPTGGTDIGAFIVPLLFGTEIGTGLPASDEWTPTQQGMFGVIAPGFSTYTFSGALGLFIDQTAYAGLQFSVGDDVYYGWIMVQEIPALGGGGIVLEYAYDTRPNMSILAGAVPEPTTWTLATLGCALLAWRVRKAKW